MPNPKQERRMMGRRPNRSDHAPRIGENRNCIAFQTNKRYPVRSDARPKSPPSNWRIRSGSTGAMIPNATMSNATITRMKMKAALPEREEGCDAGAAVSAIGARRLDFKNHREDERPFRGLLVDVAFQVHTDFFFDDAPVGILFGVGIRNSFHQDLARADQ